MERHFLLSLVLVLLLIGCNDSHIEGHAPGECSDRTDNDGDGLYDCDDSDCAGAPVCQGDDDDSTISDDDDAAGDDDTTGGGGGPTGWSNEEEQMGGCSDGTDNDGDGLIDCNDIDDCCASNDCANDSNCAGGDDDTNSGDDDDTGGGGEDLFGGADCDETTCPNCEDCSDNDGDGLFDCDDPDCTLTDYCKHIGPWSLSTHCPQ